MSDDPQKQPSDEVDQTQLDLAQKEGDAYRESLEYMIEEVAHTGGQQEAGDYLLGVAHEEAEGMYELQGEGEFEWREPDDENWNLEVLGDGSYDVEVRVEPPTFGRHDETNGDRYGETVEVTFEDVEIETGQD